MERLGEDCSPLQVIKGVYTNTSSQVLVNGWLTEDFPVNSGVRQGCPFSPLAFVSIMEPLLRSVQRDKRITDIHIPGSDGQQAKALAYMDDVFLMKNQIDINRCNLHPKIFCATSGMSVNWEKTSICSLGKEISLDCGNMRSTHETKVLGISFSQDPRGASNQKALIGKVQQKLQL